MYRWYLLVMALFLGACTGLAGEPEIVRTIPDDDRPADLGYPMSSPDLANGARLFAENCTSCHGINGDGQGELVLSGSIEAMPSFLDAEHVRAQTPLDYFNIITQGNMTKLMPPWEFVFTEQERWDVALYVHTLRFSEAQLALGAELYAEGCLGCHGETGHGDGVDMVDQGYLATDYHDWLTMRVISDDAIFVTVSEGIGESMPAFAPEWDDEMIYAVIAYARSLALVRGDIESESDTPAPPVTERASTGDTGMIRGQVRNNTVGGVLPEAGEVFLRYGNLAEGIRMMDGVWGAGGIYQFEDVPLNDAYDYVVIALYDGVNFPSEFVSGDTLQSETVDLPITIYERTEDPFSLRIKSIEIVIDRFTVQDLGTGLVVQQVVTYENESDRVYRTNREAGAGRYATLLWQLPPGSVILNDPSSPRYLLAREQYALVDTAPILPGEHQLEAYFFVPYDDGAILDQPLSTALDGQVTVTILPEQVHLIGDGFTLTNTDDGARQYTGAVKLSSGDSLVYELRGTLAMVTTGQAQGAVTADVVVVLFILAGAILVGSVGYYLMRGGQSDNGQVDALIKQIAELDKMHEEGRINHDAYQRERQLLKGQLAGLMQDEAGESEG